MTIVERNKFMAPPQYVVGAPTVLVLALLLSSGLATPGAHEASVGAAMSRNHSQLPRRAQSQFWPMGGEPLVMTATALTAGV